jgi:hypothetical protein
MANLFARTGGVAALFLLALVSAACGGDDEEAISVCDQQENVQQAVTDLANINVLSDGTTALQDGIDNVKTELDTLRDVVREDTQDEVDALTLAVDNAGDTFANLGDAGSINDKIDEIQVALTAIVTSASDLRDALSQECD